MAGATSNRCILQASAAEGATAACKMVIAGTSACYSLMLLSLTSKRAKHRDATAPDPQQSSMCTGAVPVCVQLIYEALPKGTVQFGHAFKHLSQDEDGVLLQFAEQPDGRADYVVAADGYDLTTSSSGGFCLFVHLPLDSAARMDRMAVACEPHICAASGTSLQRGSRSWMMGHQNFRQASPQQTHPRQNSMYLRRDSVLHARSSQQHT